MVWEAKSLRELLFLLIGYDYGLEPEKQLDKIRKDKERVAQRAISELHLKSTDVVADLGSGMGFVAKYIALHVKHVYCCDISKSFLEFAVCECSGAPNISFVEINSEDLTPLYSEGKLDALFSHAVFIHLNLFQIFFYFEQFKKIIKPGGRVMINIVSAETLDPKQDKYFLQMMQQYKNAPKDRDSLMQWNSPHGVIAVARYFNFVLSSKKGNELIFTNNTKEAKSKQYFKPLNKRI